MQSEQPQTATYRRRRPGLTARLVAGAVGTILCLVLVLVLIVLTLSETQDATNREEQASTSASLAQDVETQVLNLESGSRGYILAHSGAFLAPWREGRLSLPAAGARLYAADPGPEVAAINAAWRRYLTSWAVPIVALAAKSPDEARRRMATGAGSTEVDHIRTLVDGYVTGQLLSAEQYKREVKRDERRGVLAAGGGIALIGVLLAALVGYMLQAAIVPVRRIVAATKRVAAGDFDVQVSEGGLGEIGELGHAFNEMATSLAQQQSSLARQNVDLARLANVLRAVLDSTVDGILLTDDEGNVQLANRPLIQMTRELGMAFEGTATDRLLSVARRMKEPEAYIAAMEHLRENPEESTFNEFEEAETGRVYQGWTSAVRDDGGNSLGRIWTMREVTQERELDRLKDEFVATVSHELRTPLTSMMGFLQMIREGEAGELTPEQDQFLAIVYRSSERLQRLVGDLLFVARLDASGIQLQLSDVRVDEVMTEAVEAAAATARRRELDLRTEIHEVPAIRADRERLLQLVGNLVSNAIKFTPEGGTVTARVHRQDGDLVIEVEDTGIGIPQAEQDRLFQRFFRSSTATAQAIPGTGLGLVISKAIAEAHGGTISVRSDAGAGTSFRVALPIERQEEGE
jgi:signal transduction histidine kinase